MQTLSDEVALLVKTMLMIYAKAVESHAFQQKPIDPCLPATNPCIRALVIESRQNLSLSAEQRQDFITIGANVRKAIMHGVSSTVTFRSVIAHFGEKKSRYT